MIWLSPGIDGREVAWSLGYGRRTHIQVQVQMPGHRQRHGTARPAARRACVRSVEAKAGGHVGHAHVGRGVDAGQDLVEQGGHRQRLLDDGLPGRAAQPPARYGL